MAPAFDVRERGQVCVVNVESVEADEGEARAGARASLHECMEVLAAVGSQRYDFAVKK